MQPLGRDISRETTLTFSKLARGRMTKNNTHKANDIHDNKKLAKQSGKKMA